MKKILILFLVIFIALFFIACEPTGDSGDAGDDGDAGDSGDGGDAGDGGSTSITHEVDISGFAYDPVSITISVGDEVMWTNLDSATHTVTEDMSMFDSGDLAQNDTFTYTFDSTGTYNYYCTYHTSMTGTVIVE
jgi:plastocyanin